MPDKRLKIVSTENKGVKTNKQERKDYFENLWNTDPAQFDSLKNCLEQERIERTLALIKSTPLDQKKVVDLGSGWGVLTEDLANFGAKVTAVDIANVALLKLRNKDITLVQDFVPYTKLEDHLFDLVVCTELIGYLEQKEHRLLASELVRLVKTDGFIICSTPIDINSDEALEKFIGLMETEIEILKFSLSYHRLYIRLIDFFKAPMKFAKAYKNQEIREKTLASLSSFSRIWFKLNSGPVVGSLWVYLQHLSNPIVRHLLKSRSLLLLSEKVCRSIWNDAGVSHVILLGRRRPLIMEEPVPAFKQKERVWE